MINVECVILLEPCVRLIRVVSRRRVLEGFLIFFRCAAKRFCLFGIFMLSRHAVALFRAPVVKYEGGSRC